MVDQAEFQHRSHILRGSLAKIGLDTISHKSSCTAAKVWPRESRNLIGLLTIELSTEVNCLRDLLTVFNPTAIAKEQVCRGKCVAQRYSRCSRRIVIISFSPENGDRFDASCFSLEQRSTATVKYVSRFIASCLESFF